MRPRAPERIYLADLARAWVRGSDAPVRPPAGLEPERFLRAISRQTAMQTLVDGIDPAAIPPADRARMEQAAEVSRRRSVMMLLELERFLPALAEVGIRPVVLKGASLALTVYDAPQDRWFVDLDLLIEPERLPVAYDALARLGYRFSDTATAPELYDRYHFHRILVSNQGVCVEVHWALTLPESVYRYDLDALRRDAVEIPLGDSSFLAPGVVDQILHGVLQSISEGFSDLRRLLDLHLLDARLSAVERETLYLRAHAANLTTGLWLQYYLRQEILGVAMPESVALVCAPPPAQMRTLAQLGVTDACLAQRSHHDRGYSYLLHVLCTPPHLRSQEVRRFIFPGMGGLVKAGLCRQGPLPHWRRWKLAVTRSLTAGRLFGEWLRATV